jgi:hypothetical protein
MKDTYVCLISWILRSGSEQILRMKLSAITNMENVISKFATCRYNLKDEYLGKLELFAMVPDSRINSWESWFIFNLWKININHITNQIP